MSEIEFLISLTTYLLIDGITSMGKTIDCASQGLFPFKLVSHNLWWTGPFWLQKDISEWPKLSVILPIISEEMRDITLTSNLHFSKPIISMNHYSDFNHLKRIMAWILRFVDNCQSSKRDTHQVNKSFILSVKEVELAEKYWIKLPQWQDWSF